jgi:hypothetical protein
MYQCRCTAKSSWWWAERPPETCGVVIPIKLEFSASVGFIDREFVTIHGHTILKKKKRVCQFADTLQSLFEVNVMRVTQVSALQSVRPSVCMPYLNEIHYICRLNISFFSHTRIISLDCTFSVILHALLLLKRGESRLWSSHRDTFFCCDLRYSCHLWNSAQIFKSLLESG